MRDKLEAIWRSGVEACLPHFILPAHLPEPPTGRTILLALGKAAWPMAQVVDQAWPGFLTGLAVSRKGEAPRLRRVETMAASHPIPDESSVVAATRLLALASQAGAQDLVLVLLSGGASALACLPGEGLTLEEKRRVTAALLRSGAPIGEINVVRRHLSAFKGGRLALAAAPARLVTLAISDVVGDRPQDIGSGPTVADPTDSEQAAEILRRHGIAAPARGWSETAKHVPGDYHVIGSGRIALAAAADRARALGYLPVTIECEGEAREVGRAHAARILAAPAGTALITGGELTVTVRGSGKGGPNQEYALAAAAALAGCKGISGLAADTDGIDGIGGAAGAFFDGTTLQRSARHPQDALAGNDSYGFFAALGDLFVPGGTGTNVNDLRILLKPRL